MNCKYYDNFQFNGLSKKENTGLSIIHFNARSLNANFDHIKDFLFTLNIPFDVITISETWVEVEKTTDYEMLQYQAFHKVRSLKANQCVLKIILNVSRWNSICQK